MTRFKGAVFDLDGLLIDSEPIWMWAQQTAFRELGIELTDAIQHETTGMRMQESIQVWKVYFPAASIDPASMRLRLMTLVDEAFRASGKPKPGAIRALEVCRTAGCRMAIASSSMPDIIDAAMDGLGVRDFFQALVSAEGLPHGKPHPAVYLAAAEILGLDPEECIAFEDSVFGLRSAKAAGMHCIAVPEAHNRGRAEYAIADRILGSLEEFEDEFLRK
ncbi:MAG: hexitol phosphatase HxpB [Fibrobacterota bacterium]|nr:hexitol phosphatase HxpB [Fibrobacterota bacterium]